MITCAYRMQYHPAKYKPLLFFTTVGAVVSMGVALAAISSLGENWTYLFAHSITIAFPSFLIGVIRYSWLMLLLFKQTLHSRAVLMTETC
jgi:hypothetical protein